MANESDEPLYAISCETWDGGTIGLDEQPLDSVPNLLANPAHRNVTIHKDKDALKFSNEIVQIKNGRFVKLEGQQNG